MELKNLITFIHVAELCSFTKASERLGFSQSTVSFQIRQLEEELNLAFLTELIIPWFLQLKAVKC